MNNKFKNLKLLSILIVEDDIETRDYLKIIMSSFFGKIYETDNVEEAYDIYLIYKPDVIFTDIHLKNRNGLEFAKKIKDIDKYVFIVIISGDTSKENLLYVIKEGFNEFIIKPFHIQDLISILNNLSFKIDISEIIKLKNNVSIDLNRDIVIKDNNTIYLSSNEKKIISLLFRKEGFVSIEEIESKIWGYGEISESSIRSFICRLRKKVGKESLVVKNGLGYKLVVEGDLI